MKMGCQYSRVARLSSRKLKKVMKESVLETSKKIPARNPEMEILLGRGKLSSDLASSGPRRKAVWELRMGE